MSHCPGHVTGVPQMFFTQFINTMLAAQCAIGNPEIYPENIAHNLASEYDFIVVGAGSAGSVVANRLSEVENWKILLLEAGGDPTLESEIPGLLFSTLGSSIDWGYKADPQEGVCQGMKDKQCRWPRGKVLGGSSSINAMLHVRGHRQDYDNWAAQGNTGWSYKDVLPYFKKSEDFTIDADENISKLHGKDGFLTIEHYADIHPLKPALIGAWKEQGYSDRLDDENMIGVTKSFANLRDGKRCSTAKAFLAAIKDRSNLHVSKFSQATKILIDEDTKTAYGVQFKVGDTIKEVRAKKEVIISAGAIGSPQLLMLSGIGPKRHLEEIGIKPLLEDLPVGSNLQDHFIHFGLVFSLNKSKPQPVPPQILIDSMYAILTGKKGIFSTIGLTDIHGFISTENDPNYPDLQFHYMHIPFNDSYLLSELIRAIGFNQEVTKTLLNLNSKSDLFFVVTTLLRPKSRGQILLKSTDPSDHPRIIANYLKESEDLEVMLKGIEHGIKLGETNIMKSLEAELEKLNFENCEAEFGSREYWECSLRTVGSTIYHPVGTCKMGPDNDPSAVVDPELRVKGVKNLRVADASIMPTITSGNTNAPSVMIGEQVSDLIKSKWLQ